MDHTLCSKGLEEDPEVWNEGIVLGTVSLLVPAYCGKGLLGDACAWPGLRPPSLSPPETSKTKLQF